FTIIIGEPTRQDVEELQREVAEIAVKYSTGLFQGGDDYGHMCLVLGEAKYRTLIGDETWTYLVPEKPGAFDTTITSAAGEILRRRKIAEHERKIEEYETFRGVMAGIKEQILYAVEEQYLRALKQPLLGYSRVTPLEMLSHLFDNCTLGTMDLDQLETSLNDAWATDDHINEFIRKLDDKREKLNTAGIAVSDQQMVIKFVKQMYHSGNFDEQDLTNWERKAMADKTYVNAKTYFQGKYREKIANRKERKQVKQQLRSGNWEAMETGIMDSGASSSCGGPNNALIRTGEASSKTYKVPTGQIVSASERAILAHNLRDPAREVQIVPAMSETLLSVGQFADAGYVTVFDNQSVKIFDGSIELTKDAVIRGWRDPASGLYRIPLKEKVENWNTDTVLLDEEKTRQLQTLRPEQAEAINNVYELPSTEKAIRYLHAAAGFPSRATWIKAIRAGNYNSWPMTIKESGMTYELVPPDMHRQNRAEKAIQTFKDHFVAILSGVDESFPMHLWDRLLPQAEMTLNLLRQSNVAPKVSAYAYMNGPYDFNKMPLAPMGCAVQELLERRLNENGFRQSTLTPGLWTHNSKPIQFTLVVDDFGIKYVGKETAQFLIDVLQKYYTISVDWEGKKYD
ncbi:LOW QUALITY PROTEIN: hypothetical protein ACHAW6_006995, partial [Cyclotella cf. meneghiniana]